jgi:hypothetical protein
VWFSIIGLPTKSKGGPNQLHAAVKIVLARGSRGSNGETVFLLAMVLAAPLLFAAA